MLRSLARWCYRRRRVVLLAWLAAAIAVGAVGSAIGDRYSNDFDLPGTEAGDAFTLLEERFPQQAGDRGTIAFKADGGVRQAGVRDRMQTLFTRVAGFESVLEIEDPYAPANAREISPDGTIAFATVLFDRGGPDIPREQILEMRDVIVAATSADLQVEFGGNPVIFHDADEPGGREGVGLLAAVVILLITFGSVIAMGLPIIVALFGLAVGISIIGLVTHLLTVPVFTPQIAVMIGLGVGIDYALFIVTRHREGLHSGLDPEESTVRAIDTAGRAVILAGLTVVVSLMGLFLMGLSFVRGLAVGAALAVLLIMIAAVTLLPAVLGFVGLKIDRFRIPRLHRDETRQRSSVWFRWSRVVQRRPLVALLIGLAVLVPLALPVLGLRLGVADGGNAPPEKTARRAYDLLADGFGAGFNGPLLLVAQGSGPGTVQALNDLGQRLESEPNVVAVSPPQANPGGDVWVMNVFPRSAPQDLETEQLVERLRDVVVPAQMQGTGVEVAVGGVTALFVDLADTLGSRLPLFIGAVILLSFILLTMVFRSLLVPLKAAIMNVLSIAAAYGVLVAVFQWGWGIELIGLDKTGPIEAWLPMMLFAILFGLSMDYEVFLLSRVREEYVRTGDSGLAVADGLASTARVITAAAAIMVTLFLSFVLGDDRVIKMVGLGLASAIFVDATLIRMVLVPSTMELLGGANWWLPKSLDRLLPRLEVEGASAAREPILEQKAG